MPTVADTAALLLASLLLAWGGARIARRHALRRNLLDQPGARRSHTVPTPRGGGIGIVVAWVVAWVWLAARTSMPGATVAAAIGGMVLVAGVGWVDDHRPLPASVRLLVHVLAALALAAAQFADGASPALVFLALVAVPVLVNVWNFMDGIDGIATSQAALVALAWAALAGDGATATLALALAAACCGFLPLNFPRARIFLGDVGSGALGFALSVLLVLQAATEVAGPVRWLVLVLPLTPFLVDATLTLTRRMLSGQQWWTPHVTHAYQQLARRRGRHWPVTVGYSAWTAGASVLAVMMPAGDAAFTIAVFIGCCVAGALAWWAATGRAHRIGRTSLDE